MRRRRRRNQPDYWKVMRYAGVGLALLFTFLSFFTHKNLIHEGLVRAGLKQPVDTIPYSRNELWLLYHTRDSTANALRDTVEFLLGRRHFQTARVQIDNETLNMRSGPSLNSDILLQIPNGSRVDVLYFDTERFILGGEYGSWCRIRYADQEGWVWGNFLEIL